jgi:outer membrane protein
LIKQTKANVQAARLSVKMARSNYYPSVFFGANLVSNYNINQKSANGDKMSVSKQLNNNFGENLDISIHVPIFSQRMLANRVKKEKINLSNAELANTEAMNEVYTNILTLINSFNAAKQSYKASLASLEQSTLSYNMYEEKYRLGLANSLELITAKDILSSADDQFLQSKLNLFLQYQLFVLLNSFED